VKEEADMAFTEVEAIEAEEKEVLEAEEKEVLEAEAIEAEEKEVQEDPAVTEVDIEAVIDTNIQEKLIATWPLKIKLPENTRKDIKSILEITMVDMDIMQVMVKENMIERVEPDMVKKLKNTVPEVTDGETQMPQPSTNTWMLRL
jgi:hypothetical protein